MGFEKGSLLMVDYTARIKDGEVFDTTRAADAAAAGIEPGRGPGPILVSVGEGWVLRGLDEALAAGEADEDIHAEVPPEKGFGEVMSSKIRVMRSRKLGDDEEKASVGDEVEIDGRRGVIRLMASGRIKVDFNHKYAGKTLVYDARVVKVLETDEEKIAAILDRNFDARGEHAYSDGLLEVNVLEYQSPPTVKKMARAEVFRLVPSVRKIRYVETHENPALSDDAPAAGTGQDPEKAGESLRSGAGKIPETPIDVAVEMVRVPKPNIEPDGPAGVESWRPGDEGGSEKPERSGDGQDRTEGVESWRPKDEKPEGGSEKPKQPGSAKADRTAEEGVESWRPEDEN